VGLSRFSSFVDSRVGGSVEVGAGCVDGGGIAGCGVVRRGVGARVERRIQRSVGLDVS
jgi:hypothetical protein